MHSKHTVERDYFLARELRHIESRGLAINYAAIERQVNAINLYPAQEQARLKHRTSAFLKMLSHV